MLLTQLKRALNPHLILLLGAFLFFGAKAAHLIREGAVLASIILIMMVNLHLRRKLV